MKKKIIKNFIILFIGFLSLGATVYVKNNFSDELFEQIIFSLYTLKGTGTSAIWGGFFATLKWTIVPLIVSTFIYLLAYKYKKEFLLKYQIKISTLILIICVIMSLNNLGLFSYLKYEVISSDLIEKEYINPKEVEITFPEKKQNLIYIYVESLENTGMSKKNGGYENKSVIPNLEKLAKNNQNFSNSNKIGGAYFNQGNSWTAASIIGQTSGIPLKVGLTNNLTYKNKIISGAYSLGEILEENGYKNYFMMGSDGEFGSRKQYLEDHGSYMVYDYYWAKKKKLISEDYKEWWGYEDSKLFSFAKDELLEISKNDEPFNFSILTADTHFTDGYVDKSCSNKYDSHYKNSYACTDTQISEFVNWIKKQDFFQNTTIIITGDHITMQKDVFKTNDKDKRTIYNVIINSRNKEKNSKNREFTVMDMYPTTISALGATIKGNRLGLGTNLYSNKKTLSEKYGHEYLNNELKKKSKFYTNEILKSS